MMRLPEDIFKECAEIMGGKRHDYVSGPVHENFERSASVASWFKFEQDKVYATLISTKLARLATLLGNKNPRNESIRDTFKDLINYSALWADSRDERDEYTDQRVHEEIAKNYTESITKPANFNGPEESNVMKIIKLSNDLTAGDIAALRDYFKRMDHDKNYVILDKP